MMDCDYFVRLVDLPISVGGAVTPNNDGTYSIYINARLASDQQLKALEHEIDHIRFEDFYTGVPIELCENRAS